MTTADESSGAVSGPEDEEVVGGFGEQETDDVKEKLESKGGEDEVGEISRMPPNY
jgi:hypothetical protein